MSETKNKDENEHEVYSVPYTKAGLASQSDESKDESEDSENGENRQSTQTTENTPKISKKKSTERDHERPIH